MRGNARTQRPSCLRPLPRTLLFLWLARCICPLALPLARPSLADDVADEVSRQIKAAQETALQWWQLPDQRVTVARSTHTTPQGVQYLRVVFILRNRQGGALACASSGGRELQAYWRQQLSERLSHVQQEHSLSDCELEKLSLAGDVDIARFHRRVLEAEQLLVTPEVRQDPARINQLLAPIEASCSKEGLFNTRSLYGRVLATLLANH